jgi:sugar O-acyltransferase (sialic acid O-acetyltransferase NeuD family)
LEGLVKVVFIGAANPETIRMVADIRRVDDEFIAVGFLDNDPDKVGTSFHDLPVLGPVSAIPTLGLDDAHFVNLITGSTTARYETSREAVGLGARLTNFIHPSVNLSMTTVGVGNYIQEAVVLQAEVVVGDNSSIHMGSLIGHESKVGSSVFIAHAVSVSGCCRIGDGCFIGTNATILPRVEIGRWSVIGAGAVVTRDVPEYSVVVGNPGRVIRRHEVAYEDGRVDP